MNKQLWQLVGLVAEWLPVSHQMPCVCCRAAEEASQKLRKLDSRAAAAVKTAKQAASMLKVGHSMQPQAWMHVLAGRTRTWATCGSSLCTGQLCSKVLTAMKWTPLAGLQTFQEKVG